MTKTVEAVPISALNIPPQELIDKLHSSLYIQFEDGAVVQLNSAEIKISRLLYSVIWDNPEVAHVPIVSKYAIIHFYSEGVFTAKTMNSVFEKILEDIVAIVVKPAMCRDVLNSVYLSMQVAMNSIYNNIVQDNIQYAESINILDFLEIQLKPKLLDAIKSVVENPTVNQVNNTYDVLDTVMAEMPNNVLAKAYMAGVLNLNQVKQMLASRGYVTEIKGQIFKKPIASSFVLGLRDVYSFAIESRAGAKALYMATDAIRSSEYLSRELQLVTMVVEKLVDGDCGSKDYTSWFVRPSSMTGKSDLVNLVGKYYLNEDTNQEEAITEQHVHLEGKTIKLRTALNCKLADKTAICTQCFGELSYGVPQHSGIGHYAATEITRVLTQSILSTKHLTSSATAATISLTLDAAKFFNIKKNGYAFKSKVLTKAKCNYKLLIQQTEAFGLKELAKPTIDKINPNRVSRIESVSILITKPNTPAQWIPISIKDGQRYGCFTTPFLQYILDGEKGRLELDDNGRYVIDLTGWTTTIPIISMPEVEYSYLELVKSTKAMYKNSDTNRETPEALLQKTFDLVNSRLNINSALLEVLAYAFSVVSIEDNDYSLGRHLPDGTTPQVSRIKDITTGRSLAGAYGWEEVLTTIKSPLSFRKNTSGHPLDVLIDPTNVLLGYGLHPAYNTPTKTGGGTK